MADSAEAQNEEANSLEELTRFTPPIVFREMRAVEFPLKDAYQDDRWAAVLFLDISGFTALTERLASEGPDGTEELTIILNQHFTELVELVNAWGGEVVAYAGDAFAAIFPGPIGEIRLSAQIRRNIVEQAAQCALAMQGARVRMEQATGAHLEFKIGIGSGLIRLCHLGGLDGKWHLLLKGAGFEEAVFAEGSAKPGDTIIAPNTIEWLEGDGVKTRSLDSGCFKLLRLGTATVTPSRAKIPELSDRELDALKGYISPTVLRLVESGMNEYVGETRPLTVMFINLPDIRPGGALSEDQVTVKALQDSVFSRGGQINKLSVDEKGVSALVIFGLPPVVLEDVPLAAMEAARDVHTKMSEQEKRCKIGVTTGTVFCGLIGSDERKEFTVIGDNVNLAARLMQKSDYGILCDRPTWVGTESQFNYKELKPLKLKGKSEKVPAFSVTTSGAQVARRRIRKIEMVGRDHEKAVILKAAAAAKEGEFKAIWLQGEAGLGKSLLLSNCAMELSLSDFDVAYIEASPTEKALPFAIWKRVFASWLSEEMPPVEEWRRQVERDVQYLASSESILYPSTAGDFLGFPVESSDEGQIDGIARKDWAISHLAALLRYRAAKKPLCLFLDALQWSDDASLDGVLRLLRRRPAKICLVLSSRPLPIPPRGGFAPILRMDIPHVLLARMKDKAIAQLIGSRFGEDASAVEAGIVDTVARLSRGNPSFAHETIMMLKTEGSVALTRTGVRWAGDDTDTSAMNLPESTQIAILKRLDRLSPPLQLVLKVASVIGHQFDYRALKGIYPISMDTAQLSHLLEELRLGGFLRIVSAQKRTLEFLNFETARVCYESMLAQQRKKLHRRYAQWLETRRSAEVDSSYLAMAHHWRQAGFLAKSMHYYELIGASSAAQGSDEEALESFYAAIEMVEKCKEDKRPPVEHEASWWRRIGEIHYHRGDLESGTEAIQNALNCLGRGFPESDEMWAVVGARERIRKVALALTPDSILAIDDDAERFSASESSELMAAVAELNLRQSKFERAEALSEWSLNDSVGLGNHVSRVKALCFGGTVASIQGRRRKAMRYFAQAMAMADELSSPIHWVQTAFRQWELSLSSMADISETKKLEDIIEVAQARGARDLHEYGLMLLSTIQFIMGQHDASLETAVKLEKLGVERSHPRAIAYGKLGMARIHSARLDVAQAYREADQVIKMPELLDEPIFLMRAEVWRLHALWTRGKLDQCHLSLRKVAARLAAGVPLELSIVPAVATFYEVAHGMWTKALKHASRYQVELGHATNLGLRVLKGLAQSRPVAQLDADFAESMYLVQKGQGKKAWKMLNEVKKRSKVARRSYLEGRTYVEMSRRAECQRHLREVHLKDAQQIFWHLRAEGWSQELERILIDLKDS